MKKPVDGGNSTSNHMVHEYNRIAKSHITNPDPRFSPLAISFYRKSLEIEPDNIATMLEMARACHTLGMHKEAMEYSEQALDKNPTSLAVRFTRCMLRIPALYDNEEDIAESLSAYHGHLRELSLMIRNASPEDLAEVASLIAKMPPFYLAYQGNDARHLQQLYGHVVSTILAKRYPEWARPVRASPPGPREHIRVGVPFGFFFSHSVWKVILKGWVASLDQDRFTLYGYHLGTRVDAETEHARACFAKFVQGPMPLEAWCRTIRQDRPHVLLYPEIGMHGQAIQLAGLRLAPIQCATWGHSSTSGLPTMDYFLSSERIEPPGAESHYTEHLVKLPGLSICYHPPQDPVDSFQRPGIGLRPSAAVYLCAQSLFKYLPQFDEVFPRIARKVQDCQFVFLKDKRSVLRTRQFEDRLARTFSRYGMDFKNHVVMLTELTAARYQGVHALCDVYLNSLEISGATTILESTPHDLPIVVVPGRFHRGNLGAAALRLMGVHETVANDLDEYVQIAARLGNDTEWRREISAKMAQNRHVLYGDTECVRGLESFLENVVRK